LNVRLAHEYAAAVRDACDTACISTTDLDLIGSHGQTMHHLPTPFDCAGLPVSSTFQIGDPSVLANLLGIPVVGDFRMADMALGGQGAPLVPYFDTLFFSSVEETRGLLNLGGIANLTVLPPGATHGDVIAFDTGPANMVIDALTQHYFGEPFDKNGKCAAAGHPNENLLASLLQDPFFSKPPPRSTGREYFGESFVQRIMGHENVSPSDLIATATQLTASSVHAAYRRFIASRHPLDVLIVSGGGVHNSSLMSALSSLFNPIPVYSSEVYGIDADAKEALCFAVLAWATVQEISTNLPAVTGASHVTILGKICLPGPHPRNI